MTKPMKTAFELETMILHELSGTPNCAGVSMVTVRQFTDPEGKSDWKIGHINYGGAGELNCQIPMTRIVERLHRDFDLK